MSGPIGTRADLQNSCSRIKHISSPSFLLVLQIQCKRNTNAISRHRLLRQTKEYNKQFQCLVVYYRDMMCKIISSSIALGGYNRRTIVPNPYIKGIFINLLLC